MSTGVRVAVRYRPVNKIEQRQDANVCVSISSCRRGCRTIHPAHPDKPHDFSFDQVYNSTTAQDDVYKFTGKPLAEDAIAGYNSTLFAYGQTGSGKTWSMMGIPTDIQEGGPNAGVVPRLGKDIFDYVESYSGSDKFEIDIQMFQIYLGVLQDLFDPSPKPLKIRLGDGIVNVEGADSQRLHTFEDYMSAVDFGNANRNVSATGMNAESSRSHCIIVLKFTRIKKTGTKIISKVKMIDLAGSEKVGKTGASGARLKEAQAINRSLTALADCMTALSKPGTHVPFRQATLTKMLTDSLGGNCKTSLLCATSPCDYNVDETLSTLRFAAQAKKVKTKVKMAVQYTPAEMKKIIEKLQVENDAHKEELSFLEELDKDVADFFLANGGDYDLLKQEVHARMNKKEEVDMAGMTFNKVSSHVCVIDKKTGKLVGGKVVTTKIGAAGEVVTMEVEDDAKEAGAPVLSFGKKSAGADASLVADLREHVDDLQCDSEGKDMLISHLEHQISDLRTDLDAAVNVANKYETQIVEAEFYKRKLVYLEQDVMTQLTQLQIENEMLNENINDLDQLDSLSSGNASAADIKKMYMSMKKQLRKKDDKLKKMLNFKSMDDKYLGKFDAADAAGQRVLFCKALKMNTAARGHIGQAKEVGARMKKLASQTKRKDQATKELKSSWRDQLTTLEKAVVLAQEVNARNAAKHKSEIQSIKEANARLLTHIEKLKSSDSARAASRSGPFGSGKAKRAGKVKKGGVRHPRRRRGSVSA